MIAMQESTSVAAMVTCPACELPVPLATINVHLDADCRSAWPEELASTSRPARPSASLTVAAASAEPTGSPPAPQWKPVERQSWRTAPATAPASRRVLAGAALVDSLAAMMAARAEHTGYEASEARTPFFLLNFYQACAGALSEHGHVITAADAVLLARFLRLVEGAQRLWVRLFARRPTWFRAERLDYDRDLTDCGMTTSEAVGALLGAGLAEHARDCATLPNLLSLLNAQELKKFCQAAGVAPVKTASNTMQAVLDSCQRQRSWLGSSREQPLRSIALRYLGTCIRLTPAAVKLFKRLHSLFYLYADGDDGSTNSTMTLVGMGLMKYPKYTIRIKHRTFPTVALLVDYEEALQYEVQARDAVEKHNWERAAELTLSALWPFLDEGRASCRGRQRIDVCLPCIGIVFCGWCPWHFERQWRDERRCRGLQSDDVVAFAPVNQEKTVANALAELRLGCVGMSGAVLPLGQTRDGCERPGFLKQFEAGWPLASTLTMGVEALERLGRHADAVRILEHLLAQFRYQLGRRGLWWERLTVDLCRHLRMPEKGLAALGQALADPHVHRGRRVALQRRFAALSRQLESPIQDLAIPPLLTTPEVEISPTPVVPPLDVAAGVGAPVVFRMTTGEAVSVEELALRFYANADGGNWSGVHCESGAITALFGLLLWQEIFLPIDDVFRTPYQAGPLDLASGDFYGSRREEIEQRLFTIAEAATGLGTPALVDLTGDLEGVPTKRARAAPALRDMVMKAYEEHLGESCVGIGWQRWPSAEVLGDIAGCIGGRLLAELFRYLAQDYGHRSIGMPDLIMYRVHDGRVRFVEVKSRNDKLSDKQLVWIDVLLSLGVDVQVCRVNQNS